MGLHVNLVTVQVNGRTPLQVLHQRLVSGVIHRYYSVETEWCLSYVQCDVPQASGAAPACAPGTSQLVSLCSSVVLVLRRVYGVCR